MGWSWKFNLGVGFLLWLAALAVLAQVPALQPASAAAEPEARVAPMEADELRAELMRVAADQARVIAYTQVHASQRALRQCR